MKRKLFFIVWRVAVQLAAVFIFFWLWIISWLFLRFSTVLADRIGWAAGFAFLGIFLLLHALLWKHRKAAWLGAGLFVAALLFSGGVFFHRWWTVERFEEVSGTVEWWRYAPFEGEKALSVTPEARFRLSGEMPKIDGAYALYPLYAGVVQSLCPPGNYSSCVVTNGSDTTFVNLLHGQFGEAPVDMIFSAPPSRKQLADAAQAGMVYEITPFAREAFVFIVPAVNPVNTLTQAQIRGIYSGQITNWREVGGRDMPIRPFQRNEGSGSQTMLQRIMGDTPIMPPLKADRLGGMGDIINDVADYRNSPDAIGFTFRFFATEMFQNGAVKILAIDGVAPTLENIRNRSYPYIADCCVITCRPRSENTRKIVEFLFSAAGKELIQKAGYTPLDGKSTGAD